MGEEEKITMNRRQALISYMLIACSLVVVLVVRAADSRTGDWTMRRSGEPGKVEFSLITHQHGSHSHDSSDWPVRAFQGIDLSKPGRQEAKFSVTRDAGRFDCQGYLENGEGAGIFHFVPDTNYAQQMKSLGFVVDEDNQYFMAVMDVSLDFVRRIKAENLEGLDTDKLIAFRIHGASPEFIEQLRKLGYTHVDLEQLIAFRIHGVSPDFIEKLHGLGYTNPSPDELVAMRIHGVTPEYIAGLKSRGMKDLSIDQLVSLRIHGID